MPLDPNVKSELEQVVRTAMEDAAKAKCLSDDEISWVRLAIKAEAERYELRKAIVEKTLTGLIWAALSGAFIYVVHFVQNHIHFK